MAVMRDPLGIKPMCYGERDGLLVVASESIVLTNLGMDYRDLEPGEVIIANRDGYRVERYWPKTKPSHCFFEWIYFANLVSVLEGRSVYKVRDAIGRELAEIEPLHERDDHIVISVPETADTVANSFGFHLGLPTMKGLLRNRYVGRTFIDGENRADMVRVKYTPLTEILEGKKIFLVDDTLVRATTLKSVIRDLRERGKVREIHVRIGCPPITGPCYYGIDLPTISELFAPPFTNGNDHPEPAALKRMADELDADSLVYLTLDRLIKAIGLPNKGLCLACLDSNYPTPMGREKYAEALRAFAS